MGLIGVGVLALSLAFLAYNYTGMLRSILPAWLVPDTQPESAVRADGGNSHPAGEKEAQDEDADSQDTATTLKAVPLEKTPDVPSFTLNGDESPPAEKTPEQQPEPSAPSFPAPNSAQRASAMPPPPKPAQRSAPNSASSLMPPPSRQMMPRQSAATSLRLPSDGPLPNRGPPANSQQRAQSGLSPNGVISTPNARGKVLLSPGHSPMDWAALTRSGNLSGVSTFQRVTPSQLRQMTGRKGKPAWSSWQGKVYNITPYLPFHPGGEHELMKAAGRDGTKLFMEVHPWVNWENMLETCLVAMLVSEEQSSSPLDDMD